MRIILKAIFFCNKKKYTQNRERIDQSQTKSNFALSYIEETIESLNQLIISSDYKYESDINYAVSIISIFFKTIELIEEPDY